MDAARSSAAHEVAHQRGFAREDEANYLGLCRPAPAIPIPRLRYSAALEGSLYALAALRGVDPRGASARCRRGGARRCGATSTRSRPGAAATRAAPADVQEKVNDAYLRAQGQDGVTQLRPDGGPAARGAARAQRLSVRDA